MKRTRITPHIFMGLGLILLLANIFEIHAITYNALFILLADATGGINRDIVGGLGVLFFGISAILFFVIQAKTKHTGNLLLAIINIILGAVMFFVAWNEVI